MPHENFVFAELLHCRDLPTCMHAQVYNLNLLITKQIERDTAVIQNLTVIQFMRTYSIHHAQHSEILKYTILVPVKFS